MTAGRPPRRAEGRWIFLSVLVLVVGGLAGLAIYVFGTDDGGPAVGPGAPLTQPERQSLERFHELATDPGAGFAPRDVDETCREVTAVVRTKPFSPYDTSRYENPSSPHRLSPVPATAHWAAASDLETLGHPGRLVRQAALRSLTSGSGDAEALLDAVERCHRRLLRALEAATA